MTIERLERVMQRIRHNNPGVRTINNSQLRLAIMHELGTDPRTYQKNRKALRQLGWIKPSIHHVWLTNNDVVEA